MIDQGSDYAQLLVIIVSKLLHLGCNNFTWYENIVARGTWVSLLLSAIRLCPPSGNVHFHF